MEVFTEEDDVLLITLVSQHPLLYDLSDEDYKNSKKKDKIWDEIAKALNKKSENCKKRWKNIKDTYYRQKRKNKSGTGSAAPKNPRSKFGTYERLLTFLTLVQNERSTETTIEDTNSTQDSHTSDRGSESFSSRHIRELLSPVSPVEETRDDVEHDTVNAQISSGASSGSNPVFPKSNRKRSHQKKDEIIAFLKKREDSRQNILETIANKNVGDPELAMFSDYVKSVLQKLPSNLKINAKKEIFDVLLKYESVNDPASTTVVQFHSPQLSSSASAQPSTSSAYDTLLYTNQNTLSTTTENISAYSHISQATEMELEIHQREPEATDLTLIGIMDLTETNRTYK